MEDAFHLPREKHMAYWLMKSEPDVFGIDDLRGSAHKKTFWEGVRNYQARNMMRDDMRKGDLAFFYHSACAVPGIAGVMKIARQGYPDFTAFDPAEKYYDPDSNADNPRWYMVDVRFKRKLKRVITLSELKTHKKIENMRLLQKGNRLSIMPVSDAEWEFILKLE